MLYTQRKIKDLEYSIIGPDEDDVNHVPISQPIPEAKAIKCTGRLSSQLSHLSFRDVGGVIPQSRDRVLLPHKGRRDAKLPRQQRSTT